MFSLGIRLSCFPAIKCTFERGKKKISEKKKGFLGASFLTWNVNQPIVLEHSRWMRGAVRCEISFLAVVEPTVLAAPPYLHEVTVRLDGGPRKYVLKFDLTKNIRGRGIKKCSFVAPLPCGLSGLPQGHPAAWLENGPRCT